MFMINYVRAEDAEGAVKKVYEIFPEEMGVPLPLQLFSASPELLVRQAKIIQYFMKQEELEFPLLTAIRFMSASLLDYTSCIELNGKMLMGMGMSEEDLDNLVNAPEKAQLEPKDLEMFKFVHKAMTAPETVMQDDIDAVRKAGWSDTSMFDAVAHGAAMRMNGHIFKTFMKK